MFTVGQKGVNKQGLSYEIIEAKLAKKIKIRFEIDNTEVVTTRYYLKNGLPIHPTYGKWKSGDVFTDKNNLDFELISRVGNSKWKIRYLKDGAECERETSSIKDKFGTHPIDNKVLVGQVYNTRHGSVTVLKINSSIDVDIQFEDGTLHKVQSSQLRLGNAIGHPTSGLTVGQKLTTNSGWKYTIEKYVSPYEVHCRMQDGSIEIIWADSAKTGSFKPCNQPSVVDIGYIGQGRFSNLMKKEGEKAPDEVYAYWHRMIGRCFNPNEIIKNTGRRYIFVNVHKDWHNFQNFAEWAIQQPNWNMGHELDKDLFGTGYDYSSENCTFLPADINAFLAENWSKQVHDLPIGVQYIKPATTGAKEGYVSRCHTDKGREYLGYFDDPMDAYFAYKLAKEAYAKVLAEKFKDVITIAAYEKLKTFELTKIYSEPPHVCSSLLK